jgi:gliding motility-associated-like protein
MRFLIQMGLFCLIVFTMKAPLLGQMYVSPKVCVVPPGESPSLGGGALAGAVSESCEEKTVFFDTSPNSVAWQWDFGDGSPQATGRNPQHGFFTAGNVTITLQKTLKDGSLSTETKVLTVGQYPQQPKFNKKTIADTTVCDGKTLTLNPFKETLVSGNYRYLWFPNGETTQTIDVDSSGCYSVEVSDATTGCSRSAKINVKFCLQEAPSAGGGEKWHFGKGSVLDFALGGTLPVRDSLNSGGEASFNPDLEDLSYTPKANTKTHPLSVQEATGMVYGPSGNLVFYSDGKKIFAGEDDSEIKLVDGSAFSGLGHNASQGVLIVPKLGCLACLHEQYYMFSVDTTTRLLSYSVLDMRYNTKKGAVTEAVVPMAYPVTDRIVGMRSSDDKRFVVYAHENGTDRFKIIVMDSSGTQTTEQAIGTPQFQELATRGYMAISPNKRKLAQGLVENGKNYVEVFDINPTDFSLSDPIKIDLGLPAPPQVYGVTFSPNSDIVYATINGNPASGQSSFLVQLALSLNDPILIGNQKQIIAQSTTESYGAVQLGPVEGNGSKFIYLTINNRTTLPYLQNPNVIGNADAVGYSDRPGSAVKGIKISGVAQLGFPNIVAAAPTQEGEALGANYSGNCFNAPTVLSTQGVCSPLKNEVSWEFADGSVQKGTQVSYTFSKVGWNYFKMRVKIFNESPIKNVIDNKIVNSLLETECKEKVLDGSIYIKPSPKLFLPEKYYVCFIDGDTRKLGAAPVGGNSFTYDWQTSTGTNISRDSAYSFFAPQLYKLDVKNNFSCLTQGQVQVFEGCEPRLFIPDAFTPNADSVNDNLLIEYAHITDFKLRVFNRWGDLIFVSENPDSRWDGKIKDKITANQLFPYVIHYRSKYFPGRGLLSTRGSVMVIK